MVQLVANINVRSLSRLGFDKPTIYSLQGAVEAAQAVKSGDLPNQTAAEIKTAYESNSDTNAFTDADHAKLDGIESAATADQTGAEIKVAYEAESDTNAYTDAEKSKLAGIESAATADQTNAEILAAWETESGLDDADLVVVDGSRAFTGPLQLATYAVASLPSASPAGQLIYVSDESGGPSLAFSDGTNWLRLADNATVS